MEYLSVTLGVAEAEEMERIDMPTWKELKSDFNLSQEDLNAIELEKDLIRTMIHIWEEIDSLLKILTPLGYTLQIVPMKKKLK